ncbi:MAG: sensor histidine kinase [Sutterellaceae bacterium]|nr:sensor histidine kinase [Burkholderiaceae bacterium]MDW8430829.1 sensor histidine kinase [Sutterellaceae bacterium]
MSALSRLTRWRSLRLLAAVALMPAAALALEIRTVEWTPIAVGAEPAADARWLRFDLPHRWVAAEDTPLSGVALRLRFTLPAGPSEPWAVLIGTLTDGGLVSANGRFIGAVPLPDAHTHVHWRRPHLLAIDPALLTAGENTLLIRTAYRGGTHILADVAVGPLAQLAAQHTQQFFFSYTVPWIGATVAAVIALVFGVLWLRRREVLLALLTLGALFWLLRSAYVLVETMPLQLRYLLRLIYYLANGGFAAVMAIALLRLSGRDTPRVQRLIALYAALGPLIFIATHQQGAIYLDRLWLPGLALLNAMALGLALQARLRGAPTAPLPVLAAAAVALAAAVHDYLFALGPNFGMRTLALHWAGPLLLVALATPLVDRFVRILREAEAARATLETRVREREQLLKRNYERLRESERLKAQAEERQRIMQDMHDGLGSQLLSSLMLVERKAVTQEQMVQILRECIDDMRLAIDALATENAGLLSALGNLRYRMEPRFRAAGIELVWSARGLPEEIDIHPDAVLPILRIVQEALTNALKHSGARVVHVVIALEPGQDAPWLSIRVTDNGRGIVQESVGGRGLLNMRARAQKIGAQLKLETKPGAGTVVQLRYRLAPVEVNTILRTTQMPLSTQAVIERMRRE